MNLEMMAVRFRRFAAEECRGSSGLYEQLSLAIAEDGELLALCSFAKKGQPVPNLLFGAVHYLLLKGSGHELREYYPSLTANPRNKEEAFLPFKDFCRTYREEIISLLQSKLVQTNEVGRCAYLYPAFCHIYRTAAKPLACIEIGTSAGLLLFWDQYSYSYGTGEVFGNASSEVRIRGEIRGGSFPAMEKDPPPVSHRIGLDLHILDLSDPEDELWLLALIWPEHEERRELFFKASRLAKEAALQLIEGDGVALLPRIAGQIPADSALCIFHTHVANQIPREGKIRLLKEIETIGKRRDVFHLYNNIADGELHLDYFINGQKIEKTIGKTAGHGRWFEWGI